MKDLAKALAILAFAGLPCTVRAQDMAAAQLPTREFAHSVVALVDLSDQTMRLYVEDQLVHVWSVSTGAEGFETPVGAWTGTWLSRNHWSSQYNSPMPWAVFFFEGYAVHATETTERLGQAASHGCVRLQTENARIFFELVESYGLLDTLVTVAE